jgi:hypothetical protein
MRFPLPRSRQTSFRRTAAAAATAVIAAALVVGTATGASAATAHTVAAHSAAKHTAAKHTAATRPIARHYSAPAAATGVTATGTSSSVTLAWTGAAAPSFDPVRAYVATIWPSARQRANGLVVVGSGTRHVSYSHLTAGTTYTLSLTTVSAHGHSRPVVVKYRAADPAPVPNPATLFALDGTGSLTAQPAAGGAATTLVSDVQAYTVDGDGDAFVVTSTGVVKVPYGEEPETLLDGATGATRILVDAKEDVFLLEDATVVEVVAGTTTAKQVITVPQAPDGFGVRPDGTVELLQTQNPGNYHDIITIVPGSPAKTTRIDDSVYAYPVTASFDAKGDLYYALVSTGGSGSVGYWSVPVGTTTPVALGSSYAVGGLGVDDRYSLLQSATWCTAYGLGSKTCTPDLTVASVSRTSDTGVTTTVPVTGLSLVAADESIPAAGTEVTSDTAGAIYVTQNGTITRYAATGGAGTVIATGSYSDVQLSR